MPILQKRFTQFQVVLRNVTNALDLCRSVCAIVNLIMMPTQVFRNILVTFTLDKLGEHDKAAPMA